MNVYMIIGMIGVISGLICALADVPLVKPGKAESQNYSTGGYPYGGQKCWKADLHFLSGYPF